MFRSQARIRSACAQVIPSAGCFFIEKAANRYWQSSPCSSSAASVRLLTSSLRVSITPHLPAIPLPLPADEKLADLTLRVLALSRLAGFVSEIEERTDAKQRDQRPFQGRKLKSARFGRQSGKRVEGSTGEGSSIGK